jgi:hypothetical protein
MVTSLQDIADWIAKLEASRAQRKNGPTRRADLLITKAESNPGLEEWLARQERNGYRDLQAHLTELGNLRVVDGLRILLALRSVSNWSGMVDFAKWLDGQYGNEPRWFTLTPEAGQQVAMALNRMKGSGNSLSAEEVLTKIMIEHGPDAESLGILGRVYKDRWLKRRNHDPQNGYLFSALNAYWEGMQCDPSQIYPAINLLTLLKVADSKKLSDRKPETLNQLAKYIEQLLTSKQNSGNLDYFDYATWMELLVVTERLDQASRVMGQVVKEARAPWELETTAQNLSLLPNAGVFANDLRREMNARWPIPAAA